MKRDLRPFPLADALRALSGGTPRALLMTMSTGQWDGLLAAAYDQGWILVELNADEQPMRAFRKDVPA